MQELQSCSQLTGRALLLLCHLAAPTPRTTQTRRPAAPEMRSCLRTSLPAQRMQGQVLAALACSCLLPGGMALKTMPS